jgi:hypothetical protein
MRSPLSSYSNTSGPIIRASEIGQYVFCHRAWWLGSVRGYRPANDAALSAGLGAHMRHGHAVAAGQRWQQVGYVLLILGGLLVAALVCGVWGGVL